MATLKEQLEAAGYDTSSLDENTIISQLDTAGYDVSSYQQQKPVEPPPMLDTGLRAMTASFNPSPPNILPKEAQVPYTTGEEAGGFIAEKIAEEGGKRGHPILGSALGAAAYAIPKTVKTVAEMAIGGVGQKAAKGAAKVGRVAFAPTLKSAGKALGQAEDEAGIAVSAINENLPRTRGAMIETLKSWEPIAKRSAEEIRGLGKEALNVIRKESGDLLDFLNIAKQNKAPKQLLTRREVSMLSQVKDKVTKALAEEAPKVGEKLSRYADSATRANILKALGKPLGIATGTGALGAVGYGGYKLGKKILGQ